MREHFAPALTQICNRNSGKVTAGHGFLCPPRRTKSGQRGFRLLIEELKRAQPVQELFYGVCGTVGSIFTDASASSEKTEQQLFRLRSAILCHDVFKINLLTYPGLLERGPSNSFFLNSSSVRLLQVFQGL